MTIGRPGVSAAIDEFAVARLTGPRPLLDPRVDAVRGDIVDIELAGRVAASRYVVPVEMIGALPSVPMLAAPDSGAIAVSALLYGEPFAVFESIDGWSWGRTAHDHYLGWVETEALKEPGLPPSHRITARGAPVFADANIKAPVIQTLPFGARIVAEPAGSFLTLDTGGFIHARHAAPIADVSSSPLQIAALFVGAPYVWGGRTPYGVDCSGLVQAALHACGIPCPRDSDQQLAGLGQPVAFADRQAGDIMFFPGHVGLLSATDRLFHANAYWMTTLDEPLNDVIMRLEASGVAQPVLGVRRVRLA